MLVFTDLGNRRIDLKDPNSESLMCISAVVFKPTKYKQFTRPWNRVLKRWGASAFHSTDFYSGGGEFKRKDDKKRQAMFEEDSRAIPKMLGGKVEKVTLIAFRPKEYRESVPKGWLDLFGSSIHSMGIQVVLLELGWWREEKCPSLDFLYFMETGDEDEEKVHETVRGMRADPKPARS
jgi:hypothetical protein